MAGDWIKIENSTPDKAEIFSMSEALGIDADSVTGRLLRVWIWFDEHTEKGNDASVTVSLIDRIAGKQGFAESMLSVGWLAQGQRGLELPNFDRHNGKTAKTRALTAKRVAAHKQRSGNDSLTQTALPREEKRRVLKPPSPLSRKKPDKPVPDVFEVSEDMARWAAEQGLPAERVLPETEKCLDHFRGKGTGRADWDATWRNWIRKAVEFGARP